MTTTFTSISATAAAKTSAFIRKAASETGKFAARNKKRLIITSTSVVAGIAVIGGATIFAINGINNGMNIQSGAVATSTSTPKATQSAAPVDEDAQKAADAEKATAGKKVGDELTAEQAAAVSKNWEGTAIAYKLADGKFILIDRNQPLPETVKADAGAKVTAAAQASAAAGDTMNGGLDKTKNIIVSSTGHSVVVVAHVNTFLAPDFETKGWTWVSSAIGAKTQFPDAASAVAASQSFATGGVEIIVAQ